MGVLETIVWVLIICICIFSLLCAVELVYLTWHSIHNPPENDDAED